MKSSNHWMGRSIAVVMMLLLAFPASEAGSAMAQQATPSESRASQSAPGATNASDNRQLAKAADPENALPEAPAPANSPAAETGAQAPAPQPDNAQPQQSPHQPVGAAAAPYEPTMGIAASRPSGAAIAPAKQRRVRTIVISLGVVAGAAIAAGSVIALSHGSPSRP